MGTYLTSLEGLLGLNEVKVTCLTQHIRGAPQILTILLILMLLLLLLPAQWVKIEDIWKNINYLTSECM